MLQCTCYNVTVICLYVSFQLNTLCATHDMLQCDCGDDDKVKTQPKVTEGNIQRACQLQKPADTADNVIIINLCWL